MLLIINDIKNRHVSVDTKEEFETILLAESGIQKAKLNKLFFWFEFRMYWLLKKIGFTTVRKTSEKNRKKPLQDKKHLFIVMMWFDYYGYRPYGLTTNHNRSIYMFDAWEKNHKNIVDFVREFCIDYVFVSSSQATDMLNRLLGQKRFFWIPEGINPDEYKVIPYEEKNIDVLALGRRYDVHHNAVVVSLETSTQTYTYLYEKEKGKIIFPTREEFIDGLARTKISICTPSNITHPDRAGNIETMTIRYLQSMLSKCLIVGYAPKEMIELFGYNPVIEIDNENPSGQLEYLLENYTDYIPLIEKNYQQVIANHTWKSRWECIKTIYMTDKK